MFLSLQMFVVVFSVYTRVLQLAEAGKEDKLYYDVN